MSDARSVFSAMPLLHVATVSASGWTLRHARPRVPGPPRLWPCLHTTRWAAAHAAELDADPVRLAVAGDSAGANMAAVTALRVRDEGGPPLCGQLLLYPVTDYHMPGMCQIQTWRVRRFLRTLASVPSLL